MSSGILENININSEQIPDARGVETASEVLSALSNPQRLQILCHLAKEGELSVSSLLERMELSQSALSQHLARLRQTQLVECRKERQTVYYKVGREDVKEILSLLYRLYCKHQRMA